MSYKNDDRLLAMEMKLYDALYNWAKYAQDEKHTWNPH